MRNFLLARENIGAKTANLCREGNAENPPTYWVRSWGVAKAGRDLGLIHRYMMRSNKKGGDINVVFVTATGMS
jgi:hypothetical protein